MRRLWIRGSHYSNKAKCDLIFIFTLLLKLIYLSLFNKPPKKHSAGEKVHC